MSGRSRRYLAAVGLATPVLVIVAAVVFDGPSLNRRLGQLYSDQRFFELRELLESVTENSPEVLYYRGMIANAFNQSAESENALIAFLDAAGDRVSASVRSDVLLALADDYARQFNYARAAEFRERALPLLDKSISRSELAAFKSTIALWTAMSSAPPQTVDIPADAEIALTEGGEIPVTINGREIPLLPDTGSALSMIDSADAERLGLDVLDITVEVGTATGKIVKAKPCLVPELRFGGVIVRNALFLVVPEEMLYFHEPGSQRQGLMAFPILAGLREFTFTRQGRFIVTAHPSLEGPPNVFLSSTQTVIEAYYEGRRLLFFFDTGGFSTELFPSFFKAFEPEILRRGLYAPATIEGVGTRAKTPVYFMSGMSFQVAGEEVRFERPVPVLTRTTGETSDIFDGSFGFDLMTGHQELTLNYEAMRFSLR